MSQHKGCVLTEEHKKALSRSMKRYWAKKNRDEEKNGHITFNQAYKAWKILEEFKRQLKGEL